jgi:oxalate decarboxylase
MLRNLFKHHGKENGIRRKFVANDPVQSNVPLDDQNRDSLEPPVSDAGAVQTFKYPFSLAHRRAYKGGWSHEVTKRELSIAETLAGVLMRLTPGGIRELHWHKAAEWAMVLYGSARITAIDAEGKSFVSDVSEGDLWFFPAGIPHSIQGLEPDGTKFLLVFDDGNFSEYETVLLSDWMAHTPRHIVAKNFGVSMRDLEKLPTEERFIFQGEIPGPLEKDQTEAAGALGISPQDFAFRASQPAISKHTHSGEARIVDSSVFKVSTTVASALVTVHPGGMRELHWHPNADEWQYYICGEARMTIFASGGRARTMDFRTGDVGYVVRTLPHYVENVGQTDLKFLEMFRSNRFQDLSLSEWLAHTPPDLVTAHLDIDRDTWKAIPREPNVVMPR